MLFDVEVKVGLLTFNEGAIGSCNRSCFCRVKVRGCCLCDVLFVEDWRRFGFFGGRMAKVVEEVWDDYRVIPPPEWFGDARSQRWSLLGSDGGPLFRGAVEE